MTDTVERTFTVDVERQNAALDGLRRWHESVTLSVVDGQGAKHLLVSTDAMSASFTSFTGRGRVVLVERSGVQQAARCTACAVGLLPDAPLHVRVDSRGQLEVGAGDVVVMKLFAADALPADWPRGLRHAEASKVEALAALLGAGDANALVSLDLAGSRTLTDLWPVARFVGLLDCRLSSCPKLRELAPLAGLTSLTRLSLSICAQVADVSSLAGLTSLTSLNLNWCKQVADVSPLAGLTDFLGIAQQI